MKKFVAAGLALSLPLPASGVAQQVPDSSFRVPIEYPAYAVGAGPLVLIDEGHCNFHTAGGRYYPFAELLRRDGYVVRPSPSPFEREWLSTADILVIANAVAERNCEDWTLPTPSAFTAAEIAAVRDWVYGGGSLLLIVDHMPHPGNASDLATTLGITFNNGFTFDERDRPIGYMARRADGSLVPHAILEGRGAAERIDSVSVGVGSAFVGGSTLEPLIQLGPSVFSLMPRVAWEFDDDTPRMELEGWLQAGVQEFGEGRVAVFGEAAMLTAQLVGPDRRPMGMNSPEAKQNPQFLLNVVRWLSGRRGGEDESGLGLGGENGT